jgi:hypothetical protein
MLFRGCEIIPERGRPARFEAAKMAALRYFPQLLSERLFVVQKIGWILAVLCGIGWLASEIPLPGDAPHSPAQEEIVWRRTVNGWEKANDWTFEIDQSSPALHPVVLGLLMLMLSLTVGIAKNESVK